MFSNRPMTPEQLARLRRRMDSAQVDLTYGPMATDIGSGLQQLGTAIGYRVMKNRYENQFPQAPGGTQQESRTPAFQRVVEALSGNRAPWQFPTAPKQPQASPPQPTSTSLGAPAPQAAKPTAFLPNIFQPKGPGGLY